VSDINPFIHTLIINSFTGDGPKALFNVTSQSRMYQTIHTLFTVKRSSMFLTSSQTMTEQHTECWTR